MDHVCAWCPQRPGRVKPAGTGVTDSAHTMLLTAELSLQPRNIGVLENLLYTECYPKIFFI